MPGIDDIARTAGVKREEAKSVFEAVLQLANRGETVRIAGFGAFTRRLYEGRTIESPQINGGKPTKFGDSYALRFKQSQTAKQRLNTKPPKAAKKASNKKAAAKKATAKKASKPAEK